MSNEKTMATKCRGAELLRWENHVTAITSMVRSCLHAVCGFIWTRVCVKSGLHRFLLPCCRRLAERSIRTYQTLTVCMCVYIRQFAQCRASFCIQIITNSHSNRIEKKWQQLFRRFQFIFLLEQLVLKKQIEGSGWPKASRMLGGSYMDLVIC